MAMRGIIDKDKNRQFGLGTKVAIEVGWCDKISQGRTREPQNSMMLGNKVKQGGQGNSGTRVVPLQQKGLII